MAKEITISDLGELSRPQVDLILSKAEIKGEGTVTPPELDIAAIAARTDKYELCQTSADLHSLLRAVQGMSKLSDDHVAAIEGRAAAMELCQTQTDIYRLLFEIRKA